ncbi:hypothetical protein TNCV_4343931 [Trichonephila clavipes]|nr:hypothetical protein TNCV_4343931 [Trichonephila clavipes]
MKQKRLALASRKGIVFHHDNAQPHTAIVTQQKLNALGWEVLGHSLYSSDIAPSDYYLFRSLQSYLMGKKFKSLKVFLRFDEKCSELEGFSTEKRYLERSIADYRKTLSSLRNQFQDFASTLREKEGVKHRLESDVKQLLEEKIGLEKCIEEQQKKKLSTIEEERRRCESNIRDLTNKNLEMQNNINSLEGLRNKKFSEQCNIEMKMEELRAEIVNHNSKYQKYNENLKSAENALQNKVNAFGEHTVKVLQEIENKRKAFIKLPVGPIGMYLEVKQPKYTLAIEFAVGNNLLNSFCVDNYQDSLILRDILRKFYRTPPSIVVSPFEDGRFDVKGNAAISTFPTVLEMLTIKNNIVANCLIDQALIEKKLLVEDVSASIKLMNDPPKNCISAYLLNLDQICFYPSRFYSFGKSYPRSKLNSTRPEDIKNLKRDCENEILEVRKKEKCMRVFERSLKAIPGEISNLDKEIVKKTTEVRKNKNIIEDLRSREVPKDVNCLQEDLVKKVNHYNRKQAELQKCILEVNEYIEKRDKLRKELDLLMTSLQNSTDKFKGYNEKFGAQALITIRGVEVAANQGAATILRDDIASTISDSGRSASLAANSDYLSRTEKPDVNSWWIAEQTFRFSLGQKRKLLIDLHNRKLIDGVTNLSIKGEVATIQENNDLSTVNRASKYFNLLKLYPDLTKPNLVNRVVKHEVKHHILTTGQPVYSKARQLAPDKLKLAKQEFQFMLDNDIIRPSKSQWASPLHLVNKKDGTLRPCGDYRRLNAQTIPDRYPIPRIEDFNHILKDKKIFSKIDLVKAYYQIPIAEEDKEKLPSPPHLACTKFNTMSFGLRNAPSTFQRFITEVLYGLDFVFPYLDDVLVASSTEEEHSEHLKMVFERFQQYGLE